MSSSTRSIAWMAMEDQSQRQTYWCHECDMSVSLDSSSSSPPAVVICPYCNSDFLEQMEFDSSSPQTIVTPSQTLIPDDNSLLDSPYLQRLIQHLTDEDHDVAALHSHGASRSSLEAIQTLNITCSFIESEDDNAILCPICKDKFLPDMEAKQLPCKHIYHSDCILPWLSHHNTCPVCRYRLPTQPDQVPERERRDGVRFWELMEDDDLFGFGSTLRHIARRNTRIQHRHNSVVDISPTQMAQAEPAAFNGPASSLETVSSCPDQGTPAGRAIDEDGDTVLSEIRISRSLSLN